MYPLRKKNNWWYFILLAALAASSLLLLIYFLVFNNHAELNPKIKKLTTSSIAINDNLTINIHDKLSIKNQVLTYKIDNSLFDPTSKKKILPALITEIFSIINPEFIYNSLIGWKNSEFTDYFENNIIYNIDPVNLGLDWVEIDDLICKSNVNDKALFIKNTSQEKTFEILNEKTLSKILFKKNEICDCFFQITQLKSEEYSEYGERGFFMPISIHRS